MGSSIYRVLENANSIILINKSIDFVTITIEEKKDFFLKLEIYEFSRQTNFFEYRLTQCYYVEELIEFNKSCFFRSNGILIAMDARDTSYLNRIVYNTNDSLNILRDEFYSSDNFVFHSIGWSFFQVKYQNDTLVGTINFERAIPFDLMEFE